MRRSPLSPLLERALRAAAIPDRAEELALVRRAQAGDARARDALVLGHSRFIARYALKFSRRWRVDAEDVFGEGCAAFMHAIDLFDVERGCRLTTYSAAWLDRAMRRYCERTKPLLTGSEHDRKRRPMLDPGISLDTPIDQDRDGCPRTLLDTIAAEGVSPEDTASRNHEAQRTRRALRRLDTRERAVLLARADGDTLVEAGARIGVGRERARQIQTEALARARAALGG